jgi:trehalose 6-phosphate phosphatase
LSSAGLAQVGACVARRALLAFDIDGTLAPIAEHPDDARVPQEVQEGLATLAQIAPVAIVTGRAVGDARDMLGFTPRYLIGNHGAEGVPGFESASASFVRVCREWMAALSGQNEPWRAITGVALEDKACSLTFHYRQAADRDYVRALLEARARRLDPAPTLLGGKRVLNLVPPTAPDKGDALGALLVHSRCERALYVGDDVSDEAVFRLHSPLVLSVRVERNGTSAAQLYLESQNEIPLFLRALTSRLARGPRWMQVNGSSSA